MAEQVAVTLQVPCREGAPGEVVRVPEARARQLIAGGVALRAETVTRGRPDAPTARTEATSAETPAGEK